MSKSAKPEIKKIVIEVGGKRMEFTPAEAKELKTLLADLFGGDSPTVVYRDRYPNYWHWPPYSYTISESLSKPFTVYGGGAGGTAGWSGSLNSASACLTLTANSSASFTDAPAQALC